MSRISRREYLKKMGAAGLIGAAELDHFALASTNATEQTARTAANADSRFHPTTPDGSKETKTTARALAQGRSLRWPVYDKPFPSGPPLPTVQLLFRGLTSFWCADQAKKIMGVGFHCKNDHHRLKIEAFDKDCKRTFAYQVEKGEKIKFSIELTNPDNRVLGQPGALCFYGNKGGEFHRDSGDEDNDFRWLVDIEKDLYAERIRPRSGVFWPRLYVPSGLFFTLAKTKSKFQKIAKNQPAQDFGNIAKAMGANLYSEPDGLVTLKWNTQEVTLNQGPGTTYVDFSNECFKDGEHCKWFPDSDDEEKRSDFHLNYKAFHLDGKTKYGLKVKAKADDEFVWGPCKTKMEGTDLAPCMGTAFGQTSDFP